MQETTQPRDAVLMRDFLPLALADYEYLRYSNERGVKDAFIDGALDEPELVYKDIELVHLDEHLEDLDVLESVVTAYPDVVVRRAYLPKLEEVRAKYDLLRSALVGDDRAVYDASVRMYGMPREDIFHYSQRMLAERMQAVEGVYGGNAVVREALATLAPCVSGVPEKVYPFESIVLPTLQRYASVSPLSAEEIRAQYEKAFLEYGITGWQAVIDAPGERVTFNTSQELRTVFIPSDEDIALRKYPLTRERVTAIIAHEVGTHVVRRERGAVSPLALLGVGLAGYLRGEEGIATYAEQVRDGTRHFAGGLGYLAVGWAVGLDGTPRSFRTLYEVLVAYFIVSGVEHMLAYGGEVSTEAIKKKAQRQAWARCVRMFRGTSGSTPGVCFTKDIVYREGNIAIWELVARDPASVERFSLGKYDPVNEEHVAILRELGMVE